VDDLQERRVSDNIKHEVETAEQRLCTAHPSRRTIRILGSEPGVLKFQSRSSVIVIFCKGQR
jgi:hypothetical protein